MTTVGAWSAAHPDLDRLDRELLLAEALGASRAQVLTHPERRLDAGSVERLDTWASRRRAGAPLAYLLRRKEFWGLTLTVTEAVLVPRPETELLVELALDAARPGQRILDLGTGSGAIAVALAGALPGAALYGSDRSLPALAVAAGNAAAHGVRVRWLAGHWLSAIRGPFDLIVCNPPYVAEPDPCLAALAAEPRQALAAGPDGLDAIRTVVAEAPARLAPGGRLILEHGAAQGAAVRALFLHNGFADVTTHRDLAGLPRATAGCRP